MRTAIGVIAFFTIVLLIVLAGTFFFGVTYAQSDLTNKYQGPAKAAVIQEQANSLAIQNWYDQLRLLMKLVADQRKEETQLQALTEQLEQRAAQDQLWFQMKSALVQLTVTTFVGLVDLAGKIALWLVALWGVVRILQPVLPMFVTRTPQAQPVRTARHREPRVIRFSDFVQRARRLANNPAAALALLVLAIGALSVSAALGLSLIVKPAL